jgi:polyhydroxyalkanoate synthesis regulator protein
MSRRIIKHANRRLYDAVQGKVITLLELSDLVADGETVTVEIKGTGEDITAITLLHSVLERLKRRPQEVLHAREAERLLRVVRRAIEKENVPSELEPDVVDCGPGIDARD